MDNFRFAGLQTLASAILMQSVLPNGATELSQWGAGHLQIFGKDELDEVMNI